MHGTGNGGDAGRVLVVQDRAVLAQDGECKSDFMLDNSVLFYGTVIAPNSTVGAHNSVKIVGGVAARQDPLLQQRRVPCDQPRWPARASRPAPAGPCRARAGRSAPSPPAGRPIRSRAARRRGGNVLCRLPLPRLAAILGIAAASVAAAPASADARANSPKLSSAASLDRDRDGRVDAVRVVFSARVKGRGRFSLAGVRLHRVARARGRAVLLHVVEGKTCDLGLMPQVRYRSGLKDARGRRVGGSAVNMARRSGLPPRLTCAVTSDRDGDGRLDAIALTWSRPVRGGTPRAFSVRGYGVDGVSRARGRTLLLRSTNAPPRIPA